MTLYSFVIGFKVRQSKANFEKCRRLSLTSEELNRKKVEELSLKTITSSTLAMKIRIIY